MSYTFFLSLAKLQRTTLEKALSRFFVKNRRDGARLISSGILVFVVSSTQLDYWWGKAISAFSMAICLYWAWAYRNLDN